MRFYSKNTPTSEFYCEEIRDGFLVTEQRKKIWAVELDLLNELLRVCNKYNIKVFAYAGTLLGAVRHNGFIPWDDDADVCLLPEDYKKLCDVAEHEFKYPFFFQNALTDRKYFFRYSRLRRSDTTGLIIGQESPKYNNGIFLDIFILNGYTDNAFLLKKQLFEMKITWKLCRAYIADLKEKAWYKRFFIGFVQFIEKRIVTYEYLVKLNNRIQGKYDKTATNVALMTHGKKMMLKYWCDKRCFSSTKYLKFENIMLPVPGDYEPFLTHAYGDYMQFPPIEERGKWHDNVIEFDPDIPYLDYLKSRGK